MSEIAKPGDYISYITSDRQLCYGILLETPYQDPSIRRQRAIGPDVYLIRCFHEENYEWARFANHYADEKHFDTADENTAQVQLLAHIASHNFKPGDRVYSLEFSSIGTIITESVENRMYAVEFDWDLNDEEWFSKRGYAMHSCGGTVSAGKGLFCKLNELLWIPRHPNEIKRFSDFTPKLQPVENPLRVIFKMAAKRRHYG